LLYLNQFSRENFVRYGNPFQETISRIFEILNLLFRSIATQPPIPTMQSIFPAGTLRERKKGGYE
jgi:hypothetical protein